MQILETHDIIQQPSEIKINATKGTTSLYIEYKVACMYRCGMYCLSPVFITKVIAVYTVDSHFFLQTAQHDVLDVRSSLLQ